MKKTLKIEGKNKLLEVLHVTLEWNFWDYLCLSPKQLSIAFRNGQLRNILVSLKTTNLNQE